MAPSDVLDFKIPRFPVRLAFVCSRAVARTFPRKNSRHTAAAEDEGSSCRVVAGHYHRRFSCRRHVTPCNLVPPQSSAISIDFFLLFVVFPSECTQLYSETDRFELRINFPISDSALWTSGAFNAAHTHTPTVAQSGKFPLHVT